MTKLKIDGIDVEVAEGTTVLDACRQQGIEVPTMCFLDGHKHFTSCMICVVKNAELGRLIPACSALAADGMVIETASCEVAEARRVAVELLLSEHVGDCEGACQRVCPAQINIPAVIRKIGSGERDAAAAIYRATQTQPGTPCRECDGRCEKPCRRGQIDKAVSIRNLMLYALGEQQGEAEGTAHPKRFNSVIGRLDDDEKASVLALAADYARVEPADEAGGYSEEEAAREAPRCLHCDCRKPETCRLRQYAERYGAKQSRYKAMVRKPILIVQQHPNVIYEPGKCIKCGICVKICENSKETLGMAFMGRGYDSTVGVPFGESLDKGLTETAAECVQCCPTGALSHPEGELPGKDAAP